GQSAGLTLNLSSNNPFRKCAASPIGLSPSSLPPTPHSPFDDPPARPVSRNPFLDPFNNPPAQRVKSPDIMSSKDTSSKTAEELFDNLLIDDGSGPKPRPGPNATREPPTRPAPGGPPRGENIPPRGRGPPPSHRPTRSREEESRRRHQAGASVGGERTLDSPDKRDKRVPRRNSESSVNAEKPVSEEEKKLRELRRREREKRYRSAKGGKLPLDPIDNLDKTGLDGTGYFHHDGPYDALRPHRNRKGSRRAPMQAFPEGSLNNSLGGSGPLNARPDHATFMGKHDDEAFKDYSKTAPRESGGAAGGAGGYDAPQRRDQVPVFDPLKRGSILHGDESMGLGTSTFLEGTPAARSAIQRRQAETAQDTFEQGLQRKKSLAQRIRGINRGPREYHSNGRMTNPDYVGPRSGDLPTGGSSTGERNPFFNEYDKNEERISVKRANNPISPMSPNNDVRGTGPGQLERRATTDASNATSPTTGAKPQGNGLLARVKSLKGGRRRPEPPQGPSPAPGTAA
ncbi:Pal1 cell morphology protein-domain-containing protein, partial [Pseudomassariella vexata]